MWHFQTSIDIIGKLIAVRYDYCKQMRAVDQTQVLQDRSVEGQIGTGIKAADSPVMH